MYIYIYIYASWLFALLGARLIVFRICVTNCVGETGVHWDKKKKIFDNNLVNNGKYINV